MVGISAKCGAVMGETCRKAKNPDLIVEGCKFTLRIRKRVTYTQSKQGDFNMKQQTNKAEQPAEDIGYPHFDAVASRIADDILSEASRIAPHIIGAEGVSHPFNLLLRMISEEIEARIGTEKIVKPKARL